MDWTWKVSDLAIIFATLFGPVLAVQAQKWLEAWGKAKQQRLKVFHALMSTRATRLAPLHVEALNSIELEFYGVNEVISAYRLYLDNLGLELAALSEGSRAAIYSKRDELFTDILFIMSRKLGYNFDRVQLMRGVYYPAGHGNLESSINSIREGVQKVLSGEQAIAMRVTEFPYETTAPSETSNAAATT